MRYLATNVRIYKGTNSRGDYHYMSIRLFNDKTPAANPTRLPYYYVMQEITVNAFLACTDALTENENGWIDVDMSKVPDQGLTKHHLDLVRPEVVTLDGFYQPCYTRDYTDTAGVFHAKGTPRMGRNNQPLPPVNELRVYVQYMRDEDFGDLIPVETKTQIAQGVLERGYIKLKPTTADASMEDAADEEAEEDDKEAKRKALEEQLKALG